LCPVPTAVRPENRRVRPDRRRAPEVPDAEAQTRAGRKRPEGRLRPARRNLSDSWRGSSWPVCCAGPERRGNRRRNEPGPWPPWNDFPSWTSWRPSSSASESRVSPPPEERISGRLAGSRPSRQPSEPSWQPSSQRSSARQPESPAYEQSSSPPPSEPSWQPNESRWTGSRHPSEQPSPSPVPQAWQRPGSRRTGRRSCGWPAPSRRCASRLWLQSSRCSSSQLFVDFGGRRDIAPPSCSVVNVPSNRGPQTRRYVALGLSRMSKCVSHVEQAGCRRILPTS
jgi:hypothetical protein